MAGAVVGDPGAPRTPPVMLLIIALIASSSALPRSLNTVPIPMVIDFTNSGNAIVIDFMTPGTAEPIDVTNPHSAPAPALIEPQLTAANVARAAAAPTMPPATPI